MSSSSSISSKKISYSELHNNGIGYWGVFAFFGLLVLAGIGAFNYIHHHGHYVTGMNNQIVWGIPHVFAIFLIIAASGAANIATISTVFGKQAYQALERLSLLLAASLLVGGLMVLLLDLGSIYRVISMAQGALNFSSIFAWNMLLYAGFLTLIVIYLWTMMERTKTAKMLYKPVGITNLIWRFILTMGTASIFGVLVARQYYPLAIMLPLFIATSYVFGTAIYSLLLVLTYKLTQRKLEDEVIQHLRYSLPLFIAAMLFFEVLRQLTNHYLVESYGLEPHIFTGNIFSKLFWFGQMLCGSLLPMALLWSRHINNNIIALISASTLAIIGGFIQLYIIIIGGQSYPLVLFSKASTSSSFADGVFNNYTATLAEYLLGFGGIGVSFCMVLTGMKVFRILPTSLVK